MARFGRSDDKKARDRNVPGLRIPAESAISIIGPGMRVDGDLTTDGTVRVEGSIHGTLRAGKAVVLGVSGEVVGDIFTQDAVIGGKVRGTVVAESRLELQSTCSVDGEIRARAEHLQLHEGARFSGQIQMLGEEIAPLPEPVEVPSSDSATPR
jgi:cytoskeletal protein CcmA (bactofilin family)